MDNLQLEATEILPLFPTYVWKLQLPATHFEPLNTGIRTRLQTLTEDMPRLTMGQKWQTDQQLHQLAEFSPLVDAVRDACKGIVEFQKVLYTSIEITGCWANISAPGARHKAHTHPNNYLSGVYYVQTQSGADRIDFDDPRPQTNIIAPATESTGPHTAGTIHVNVREGMMVLFPSWLQHSVPENQSNQERISVSFNVMFTQFAERMSSPKWTGNVPVRQIT